MMSDSFVIGSSPPQADEVQIVEPPIPSIPTDIDSFPATAKHSPILQFFFQSKCNPGFAFCRDDKCPNRRQKYKFGASTGNLLAHLRSKAHQKDQSIQSFLSQLNNSDISLTKQEPGVT